MRFLLLICVLALSLASPALQAASQPQLASRHAMVVDASTGEVLYAKNAASVESIASVTKLMTAMVVLDAKLPMDEIIEIGWDDVDQLKHTASRMRVGTQATRREMLLLALMSSENRAASSLSRHYPGGRRAFIAAMQRKAKALGMNSTRFLDPTGLTPANVSTAEDLVKMTRAAAQYPLIHQFSTTPGQSVSFDRPRYSLNFNNTNALVRAGEWDIKVSKTGYIEEAGRCLVMMVNAAKRPLVMVFLDADGKLSTVGDASRVRQWLEGGQRLAGPAPARSKTSLSKKTVSSKKKAVTSAKKKPSKTPVRRKRKQD